MNRIDNKNLFFVAMVALVYVTSSLCQGAGRSMLYVAASMVGRQCGPTIYKIDITSQKIVSRQEYAWDKGAMTGICQFKGRIIASMYNRSNPHGHEVFVIDPLTLMVETKIRVPFKRNYLHAPYSDPIHQRLGFRGKDSNTYLLDIEKGMLRDPVDFGEETLRYAITVDIERGRYFQLRHKDGKCVIEMRAINDGKLLRSTQVNLPEHCALDKAFIGGGGDTAIARFWINRYPQKSGAGPVGSEIVKLDLATGNIVSHLPLASWRSTLITGSADGRKMVIREVVPQDRFTLKIIETSTFDVTSTLRIKEAENLGSILDGTFIEGGEYLVLSADSRKKHGPGFVFIINIKNAIITRVTLDAGRPVGMITMTN